jgi:YVTN family beta-propeller protein
MNHFITLQRLTRIGVVIFMLVLSMFVLVGGKVYAVSGGTVSATISVGSYPFVVAVNPTTNKAYVTRSNTYYVSVIDCAANTVTNTINLGMIVWDIITNPTTNTVYVTNYTANKVSVINGSSNAVTATISVGSNPSDLGVNSTTNRIYVANWGSNNVSVINGSTSTVITTIAVGNHPGAVAVNPTTNKIYVGNFNDNSVSVIDGSTNTVTATINNVNSPNDIATPTMNMVYVTSYNNTVSVIDGSTNTVTATISGFNKAFCAAVNLTSNLIYVTNNGNNTVSVIKGSNNTIIDTISVGSSPMGVAINPTTNKVYVANNSGANVSVINGVLADTVTTTTSSQNPSTYGQSITFNAVVSSASPPTGTVQFNIDGSNFGVPVTLSGGSASSNAITTLSAANHVISASYSGDINFDASNGTLSGGQTVNPASLTIKANNDTKTYGGTKSYGAGSMAFTPTGLQNGQTIGSVTITASGGTLATDPVASYTLTPSAATGGTFTASNYNISYQTGTLTVTPKSLTITASDATKTYGQTKTFAGTEFTTSGLINGNTVTSVTLTSAGAPANASMSGSPYAIVPSNAQGTGLSNYSISYVNGMLTVTAPTTGQKWYTGQQHLTKSLSEVGGSFLFPSVSTNQTWTSNVAATQNVTFGPGTWSILINTNSDNWNNLNAEIGTSTGGTNFTAFSHGAADKSYSNGILTIRITTGNTNVTAGNYLALKITKPAGIEKTIATDGTSYILIPTETPPWPVPELTAGLLFGLGLAGLGGVVVIKRRRMARKIS